MPILSICIPTYNRAELLESALSSLVPQIADCGDEVELVVTDNCSTDHTRELVERLRQQCRIRYHRNEQNVGVIRNVLGAVMNLARGEFCWLMGDDEMVRDGGVRNILEAIKANTDLDYFYVNYSVDDFARREGVRVTSDDFREWTRTGSPNLEPRRVDQWETLVAEDFNGLTPVYCSVFRRSVWLSALGGLRLTEPYLSIDSTYPHSVVFAQTMIGKPAWSSGHPWVIMCGKESWSDFIPAVVLLRFHELLDAYLAGGIHHKLVEGHRRRMLRYAGEPLTRFLQGETAPGLENFSLPAFVARHYRYREAWQAIHGAVLTAPLQQIARRSALVASFAVAVKIFSRCVQQLRRSKGRANSRTIMEGERKEHS